MEIQKLPDRLKPTNSAKLREFVGVLSIFADICFDGTI